MIFVFDFDKTLIKLGDTDIDTPLNLELFLNHKELKSLFSKLKSKSDDIKFVICSYNQFETVTKFIKFVYPNIFDMIFCQDQLDLLKFETKKDFILLLKILYQTSDIFLFDDDIETCKSCKNVCTPIFIKHPKDLLHEFEHLLHKLKLEPKITNL